MNVWEFMGQHPILTVIILLIIGEAVADIAKIFKKPLKEHYGSE